MRKNSLTKYRYRLESRANTSKNETIDLTQVKLWDADDPNLPRFDELNHCEIGKWAIFKVKLTTKK